MSAWKPGDVVVFGEGVRAIWQGNQFATVDRRYFNEWQLRDARRLLVIDPDDREQVERLMTLYAGSPLTDDEVPDMQAALREFAKPNPPRPTEPLLPEVRVMADGNEWARVGPWWVCADLGQTPRNWDWLTERDDFQIAEPLADWERDLLNGESR